MSRDVIVIGAGGGGPVVAKELAAQGLDVLVLEAGARFEDPEREWSHLENDANNGAKGYFRTGPSDRRKKPWLRDLPQNSYLWQVSGVGGTTLHYYGNSPRAMPGVFRGYRARDRDAYDRAHEFPFAYRELIPYYEWVEFTLPVQRAAVGTKEVRFLEGAQRSGLPHQRTKDLRGNSYRPQENAILQPGGTAGRTSDSAQVTYPQARGCTFCGYCLQGCYEPRGAPRNLKAKRSTDSSYVPMMLTADAWQRGGRAVRLVTDAHVTRILFDRPRGRGAVARGVEWRDTRTGRKHTETAKVVVMAGGCVENPRLWLRSGLPDPNGWVGRGLTDHYLDWVVGLFDDYTGSSLGPASAARADFPGRGSIENVGLPPGGHAFSASYSDSGMSGLYDNGSRVPLAGADAIGRQVGNDLRALMEHGVDRALNMLILTDDDVEPRNRVTLSQQVPPDEHGPVARVRMNHRARSARTRANRDFLALRAAEILRAAGAKRVIRMNWPPIMLHVQSTMRMGADRRTSVLDARGEARWVDRLFVADNSALPNSLGGPNPTLTTQAVATRTAEHIVRRYFDGDGWVRRETPVRSIDPAVTRAVVRRGL